MAMNSGLTQASTPQDAQHARHRDNRASPFALKHVREESADGVEVGEGIYPESAVLT